MPPRRRPSLFPPGKEPHLRLDPGDFCTQRILAEGTCKDLALGSKYICCDPTSGNKRPGRKTSIAEPGKTCESEKWTPIFTCDNKCETALSKGCDDNDHWMALPPKEFSRAKCNTQYTICANGKRTWGYVRDRSSTQRSYEVSPGIQKDLDVKIGDTFQGTIYPPGADDNLIRLNPCCAWPPLVLPERLDAPGRRAKLAAGAPWPWCDGGLEHLWGCRGRPDPPNARRAVPQGGALAARRPRRDRGSSRTLRRRDQVRRTHPAVPKLDGSGQYNRYAQRGARRGLPYGVWHPRSNARTARWADVGWWTDHGVVDHWHKYLSRHIDSR